MKIFYFLILLLNACSQDPVATGSKRDPLNVKAATGTSTPTPSAGGGGSTAGDATNGATLLASNCEGCHKKGGGGIARDLTKTYADATMLAKADSISSHSATVKQSIKDYEADYIAALALR